MTAKAREHAGRPYTARGGLNLGMQYHCEREGPSLAQRWLQREHVAALGVSYPAAPAARVLAGPHAGQLPNSCGQAALLAWLGPDRRP